jgi:hypothetical protein
MYQIDDCGDVFVDACVRNEASQLVFLSVYGRDTAVKELMARIELGAHDNHGLRELRLKGSGIHAGEHHTVVIADPKLLDKHTGRLPKRKLFGNLTHVWIYDGAICTPDKGARTAWLLDRVVPVQGAVAPAAGVDGVSAAMRARIWAAVSHLATIPLMAHWQDAVLAAIWRDMVFEMGKSTDPAYNPRFSQPLGGMQAFRIALTEDFPAVVSSLIKGGQIGLKPEATALQIGDHRLAA